jgi:uncharacterized membrane protein YbhN (UPF0104 family)
VNRRYALIQAAVSLVALGAVVWWASRQEAPHIPSDAGALAWMVAGALVYALATCVRAERWHRILGLVDVRPDRRDSYGLTTVGYMGNNVLPARAGEALRVVLLSNRSKAGKRELAGTVIAERLLDALALGGILVVVVFGLLQETTLPSNRPFVVAGLGLTVLVAGIIAFEVLRRRGALERARELVRPLAGAPRALLSPQGVLLLVVSVAIWVLEASVYLAVARAVDLDISSTGSLYLVALTNLFAMLPAAPGYVGTFDAAVIFGVKALGGSSGGATGYLLLLRFLLFVPITVVGLAVLVSRYGGWAKLRSAARSRLETSQA